MTINNTTFDIIIIGGGTAGLVLANRLSENPKVSILVLEAGMNRNTDPKVMTPGFLTQLYGNPEYVWMFNTVAQPGLDGRVTMMPQGKVLGGSSAVNALTTNYPSPKTFDIWTKLGNKGWDAKTMRPYYAKFETFNHPSSEIAKGLLIDNMDYNLHGTNGPIQTSISKFIMKETKLWNPTFQNLGMKATGDPIIGEATGSFICPNYIDPKTMTRSHSGVAYYEPVSGRSNLVLQTGVLVERILFSKLEDGSLIATGVQTKSGSFHATKEVILSAGSFNSPATLERSGVGNPELLKSLGIDVLIANPNVGENLQDHLMSCVAVEVKDENDSLDSLRDPKRLQEALKLYFEQKTGPLSSGLGAMAYLPVINLFGPEDTAIIKDHIAKYVDPVISEMPSNSSQKIQAEQLKSILLDPNDSTVFFAAAPVEIEPKLLSAEGLNTVSFASALVHPFSRGTSHITSNSATDTPLIDPKYLSHPMDLEVLSRHVLFVNKVIKTEPMASILKSDGKMNPPSLETLDEAKAWVKKASLTQFHPCGTCAMMAKEMGGVVDDKLRVYGVKNLRVVDASIFPVIPKGPITSSVYAIAERAADLIKEDLNASM